jgi:transposase-like protein
MPKSYSPEFRRKVLDLLKAGRPIAEVASDLGVTAASIYTWRNQELIDSGEKPGVTTTESVELKAARRKIAELETELAVTKRANERLKEVVPPKGGTRPSN